MHRRILIFSFFIIFYFNTIFTQNHFIKIIDFDSLSQSSQQIVPFGNDFLLGFYQTCNDLESQCSGILKVDDKGEILDKVLLEKFSNNSNSILLNNKHEIFLTGEEYNSQTDAHSFLIHKIDSTSLKSIDTLNIFSLEKPLVKMFQLSNSFWNNKYVISGNGRISENSYNKGTVYILNSDFILDTLLYFDFANKNISCWNTFVDNKNRLNISIQFETGNYRYSTVMKYDTSYNLVWRWTSPEETSTKSLPYGFELNNGDIIINLEDNSWASINQIYCVGYDSIVKWKLKWTGINSSQSRIINGLRQSRNGDILGVGRYSDLKHMPRLENVPFIFKLDPLGNLKWLKVYYKEQYYKNGYLVQGEFSDIVEDENGNLLAVGRIHNVFDYDPKVNGPRNDWDILFAKLNNEGCLNPDCDDINIIDTKTNVSQLSSSSYFEISCYPNPVSDNNFYVEVNGFIDIKNLLIEIYDISNKLIYSSHAKIGINQIEIMQPGIYIAKLNHNGNLIYYSKLVKI